MRKDRLLKLADYLETVPRKAFNISLWEDETERCGFSGCAVGWAIHGKLFRGFHFSNGFPKYEGESNWGAVRKVFGLTNDDAVNLFHMEAYAGDATPKQVSKNIRKFVKDHERQSSAS